MDIIGIDLHKRESQLCILAEDGAVTEQRIVTSRERFTAVVGTRPPSRVLMEASTESEWVTVCLEGFGHEVVVADQNYAPMYATRSRRVKTDRLDAKSAETAALRAWGLKIAARRGNRVAAVALARRLAGILYAMWRDDAPYTATKIRGPQASVARAS